MIFVSYRRLDTEFVNRLDDALADEFGRGAVFRDRTRLKAGEQWEPRLTEEARDRLIMLAIIGPDWLGATEREGPRTGERCLLHPDDWVLY